MNNDVLLDENYDLAEDGDEWAEGESDAQDVDLLCILEKGEIGEFPFVGFGIERRLKSKASKARFVRELKVELESDGFVNPQITATDDLSNFKIIIE